MKKLKILHILNSDRYSGAENVVISIIDNMHDVECAYESLDGPIRQTLKNHGIRFYPVRKTTSVEVKKVIDSFRPDIIHAHDYTAGMAAALTFTRIPIINHLHNNSPWLKNHGIKSLSYAVCARRFDRILTVSDSIMDEYVFGELFRSKTVTVGNPVDTAHIRQLAGNPSVEKEIDIAFLGRFTQPKDPLRFIRLIKKIMIALPSINVKAVMIGDGELRYSVRKEIQLLGLQNNIKCTGFRNNPYKILKRAKIMIMPSIWEGYGLAAVEGLALGLPVVSTSAGGLKNIVNDNCGQLCNDDGDFVEEVTKLLSDKDYYDLKSDNARKRANELDNIDKYIKGLEIIYREL